MSLGIWLGAIEGVKFGTVLGGATAAGAVLGGAIGGAAALIMRLKDRIIGPPVVYYDLFGSGGSGGGSTMHTGGSRSGLDMTGLPHAAS